MNRNSSRQQTRAIHYRNSNLLLWRRQVRFYVESSLDGVAWRRLGSSTYVWTWAGAHVMYDGLFETPLQRGEERVFDMGVCPIWADLRIQTHLLAVTMITCFNIAARTKRQMLSRFGHASVW
jgi:hypothetical protein